MKENKKQSLILILCLLLTIIPQIAKAGATEIIVGAVLGFILAPITIIGYLLAYFSSQLVIIAGVFADLMIEFQKQILNTQGIVGIGWPIVRDIANLAFIIPIIIIALANILRIQEYGIQKKLPTLIIAAILVNFSYEIAAIFVNFSQVLIEFFFSKINGNFSDLVGQSFGPQRLWSTQQENFLDQVIEPLQKADNLGIIFSTTLGFALSPYLITIFNLIITFVAFIFGILLLIRFIYLSILIILFPIVWLLWIVPGTQKTFNEWWSNFMKWIFFAPILAFFVYLIAASLEDIKSFSQQNETIVEYDKVFENLFKSGLDIIIFAGLFITGFFIANSLSIPFTSPSKILQKGKSFGLKTAKLTGKAIGFGYKVPKILSKITKKPPLTSSPSPSSRTSFQTKEETPRRPNLINTILNRVKKSKNLITLPSNRKKTKDFDINNAKKR